MIIRLSNLGQYGHIADVDPSALPPEAFSYSWNVVFREGSANLRQGQEPVASDLPVKPHFVMPWSTVDAENFFYGDNQYLYLYEYLLDTNTNVTRYTATPGDYNYTADTYPEWNGGILGAIPILNNGVNDPQQWNDSNTRFEDLSNWPASTKAKVMRPFKNFLIAMDMTESSVNYPTKIRWSHPAEPGAVPSSWDYTDPTKLAGAYNMSETCGEIIDCHPMGDVNVVYKSDSVWLMNLVGGQYVFNFSLATRDYGIMSQGCVCSLGRRHVFLTRDDVIIHDGSTFESVANGKVRRYLAETVGYSNRANYSLVPNYPNDEILVFVSTGVHQVGKVLAWNYKANTWSLKLVAFPSTLRGCLGMLDGQPSLVFTCSPYFSDSKHLYRHDHLFLDDSGPIDAGIEREQLALAGQDRTGQIVVDSSKIKFVRSMYPRIMIDQDATFYVKVAVTDGPKPPVSGDYTSYEFHPYTDHKIDINKSGRYISYQIVTDDGTHEWKIPAIDFDIEIVEIN